MLPEHSWSNLFRHNCKQNRGCACMAAWYNVPCFQQYISPANQVIRGGRVAACM